MGNCLNVFVSSNETKSIETLNERCKLHIKRQRPEASAFNEISGSFDLKHSVVRGSGCFERAIFQRISGKINLKKNFFNIFVNISTDFSARFSPNKFAFILFATMPKPVSKFENNINLWSTNKFEIQGTLSLIRS